MYVRVLNTATVNSETKKYVEVYVDDDAEAATVPTDYMVGSKMYVVGTGELYVLSSTGWHDTNGVLLS